MANINTCDIIFATLTKNGSTLANLCICGAASVADILRQMRSNLPTTSGLADLRVRNTTQGWSAQQAVYLG